MTVQQLIEKLQAVEEKHIDVIVEIKERKVLGISTNAYHVHDMTTGAIGFLTGGAILLCGNVHENVQQSR